MYIVFFIIILLIIGIIFSKISINIEKIEITNKSLNFKIKVKLLLFCFLPIFTLQFNENRIQILLKKLKHKNNSTSKTTTKSLLLNKFKKIKNLKIQINFANFTLKIGTENIFLTTFIITLISTLLANFFQKNIKKLNNKKINYIILPEFNKNEINYEGKTNISFKVLNLIYL